MNIDQSLEIEGHIKSTKFQQENNKEKIYSIVIENISSEIYTLVQQDSSVYFIDNKNFIYVYNLDEYADIIQSYLKLNILINIEIKDKKISSLSCIYVPKSKNFISSLTHHYKPKNIINIHYHENDNYPYFKLACDQALERWSEVIVGIQDNLLNFFGSSKEIKIYAFTSYIDGIGKTIGEASILKMSVNYTLPIIGRIEFDALDIKKLDSDGYLVDAIIHEIGHILGIGTLWHTLGLVKNSHSNNPVYIGQKGMIEYAKLLGKDIPIPVPLENIGGVGSIECHWRESIFNNEIMTSLLGSKKHLISRLTIAALEDIGFKVDYDAADDYTLPLQDIVDPGQSKCTVCKT